MMRLSAVLPALSLLGIPWRAAADQPTCTTHFFDWYVVNERSPLEEIQKRWTYRVDWGAFGIAPAEIGNSVHCYEAQCRKIKEAGFDGIHYEWHGNNPQPQFIEAIRKTGVPMAMFYDMEIRFHSRANGGRSSCRPRNSRWSSPAMSRASTARCQAALVARPQRQAAHRRLWLPV
jgi:hypothetical protein